MKTIAILFFTIILNACSSAKTTTDLKNSNMAQSIPNGEYIVNVLNSKNISKTLTLNFDDKIKRISGFSGCNTFFGSYTLDGNTIIFGNLASTEKYCIKDENKVESQMLNVLDKTTSFKLSSNNITLLNNKTELLTANKTIEAKIAQENIKIEYTENTRGFYKKVIIENKTVSVQNHHSGTPVVKPCNDEEWNTLLKAITNFNLKSMSTLEAPSKAHQYDGAKIGSFSITKQGNTYQVPSFDAGNPNKNIASLVTMVLNIAETTKEKN